MTDLPLDPIAIDVGHLLQGTVASLYSHLVTRETGRAVRMAIETQLAAAGGRSLSLIDLSEVEVLDFSCADEVVAKLMQRYEGTGEREAFFVFRGVHEPHQDQIDVVLKRQRLAVVAETRPGVFELLGERTGEEDSVWRLLEEHGLLVKGNRLDPSWSSGRQVVLDRLALRRLVFRSPISGRYHALSRLVSHLM
jgi:hypothetical protein